MSEPIKVTREQWDAAVKRHSESKRCCPPAMCSTEACRCRDEVARVLDQPRPAPDTPPDLDWDANRRVARVTDSGYVWVDTNRYDLLLPWVRDHLLPWLEAKVEVAPDA